MLALGILTLLKFSSSAAQSTNATCLPAYRWAFNSKNQTPCLVAAYLESACLPSPLIVPALPGPQAVQYQGPIFSAADPCKCSTVTYSVISACGACQGHVWESWGNWSINCITPIVGSFPKAIPSGTEVPLWAYMNVTKQGTFSPQLAQMNATAPLQSSTSVDPSPTSNTAIATTTIPTPPPTTTNSTSNSHAGAIAGGVVGGLAGIVIIGLGAFWTYIHRHRSVGRPTPVYGGADLAGAGAPLSPQTVNGPIFQDASSPQPVHHRNMSESSLPPVSPMTSGIYTSFGARSSLETLPQTLRGFRGVAEV